MKNQFILVYSHPSWAAHSSPITVFFDDMPSARVYISDLPEGTKWDILDTTKGYIIVDAGTRPVKKAKR